MRSWCENSDATYPQENLLSLLLLPLWKYTKYFSLDYYLVIVSFTSYNIDGNDLGCHNHSGKEAWRLYQFHRRLLHRLYIIQAVTTLYHVSFYYYYCVISWSAHDKIMYTHRWYSISSLCKCRAIIHSTYKNYLDNIIYVYMHIYFTITTKSVIASKIVVGLPEWTIWSICAHTIARADSSVQADSSRFLILHPSEMRQMLEYPALDWNNFIYFLYLPKLPLLIYLSLLNQCVTIFI